MGVTGLPANRRRLHNTRVHLQGAPQRLAAKRPHLGALSGATRCCAAACWTQYLRDPAVRLWNPLRGRAKRLEPNTLKYSSNQLLVADSTTNSEPEPGDWAMPGPRGSGWSGDAAQPMPSFGVGAVVLTQRRRLTGRGVETRRGLPDGTQRAVTIRMPRSAVAWRPCSRNRAGHCSTGDSTTPEHAGQRDGPRQASLITSSYQESRHNTELSGKAPSVRLSGTLSVPILCWTARSLCPRGCAI